MSEVNNTELKTNSMQAKFTIQEPEISFKSDDSLVEIEVPKKHAWKHASATIGVGEDATSDAQVEIGALKDASDETNVQVYVSGRNCMQAVFDLQVPPIITTEIVADMDSYTVSTPPKNIENFGDMNAMHVQNSAEIRDSFVYFHLPLWYLETVVFSTKLRLYYRGEITGKERLRLMENRRKWYEYGVTDANAPPVRKDLTNEYTVNFEERYIEFDVFDVVEEWRKSPELNYGFRLSTDEVFRTSFYTRETPFKPMLVTKHYDPQVRYPQRVQRAVEITAGIGKKNCIPVEIEPQTTYKDSLKEVQIKAYTYGDTIYEEVATELWVTKKHINVELAIGLLRESDKNTEIAVRQSGLSVNHVELTAIKKQIPVDINVVKSDNSNTKVELGVLQSSNKNVILSVGRHSDKEVDIHVKGFEEDSIAVNLPITRKSVDVEFTIRQHGDINVPVQISPKVWQENTTPTLIAVIRKDIFTELYVADNSDIEVKIQPKVWGYDETPHVELQVTKKQTLVQIRSAILHSKKEVQIRASIPTEDDIHVEVTPSMHDNRYVELKVTPTFSKQVELSVKRTNVHVEMGILANRESITDVEITPRLRRTSNQNVIIMTGDEVIGYVYLL